MKIAIKKLLLAMANVCITDNDLSIKSGVSKPTLAKIKTGKQNPKPVTIGKLAKALDVKPEYLIEQEV